MSGEGKKAVCVTSASGYITSWLVKLFLLRGYIVKATVCNLSDPRKTKHLLALDGANKRLHLFRANLLEDGSFDFTMDGCEGVFHTASPVTVHVKDPQPELLDPAVKGMLNVLSSCEKFASVKRVVLTSSVAAIEYNGRPQTPKVVVDESWFSDPEVCKEAKMWYLLAKTLAEEAASKLAKERGIDTVTINPAVVFGPLLQPTLNTSVASILELISRAKTYPNLALGWVHVRDVASAHIQAFEIPSANGRYFLVESVAHCLEVVKILRELYPDLRLPIECSDGNLFMPTYKVSKDRAKSLGIDYIHLKVSLWETVESLKAKNDLFDPSYGKTFWRDYDL
ncbi:hypothetical protein Nepgr_032304 [Nepenthes gracilis]|uniref:NAD-dependent epimerase/dehydratase domain-containing protein n=1 Tax=Nepenthes gracilis TaxID=150966 RepID=A0AAD3TJS2_NEPGR|nr:hypothetical protein Nepgr_032304 [Nepenthes gracilis]